MGGRTRSATMMFTDLSLRNVPSRTATRQFVQKHRYCVPATTETCWSNFRLCSISSMWRSTTRASGPFGPWMAINSSASSGDNCTALSRFCSTQLCNSGCVARSRKTFRESSSSTSRRHAAATVCPTAIRAVPRRPIPVPLRTSSQYRCGVGVLLHA